MTSRDFCYWLQGYFEITSAGTDQGGQQLQADINGRHIECIRNHLAMVFKHEIDPSFGDSKHQAELSQVHAGGAAGKDPKQILGELLASQTMAKC